MSLTRPAFPATLPTRPKIDTPQKLATAGHWSKMAAIMSILRDHGNAWPFYSRITEDIAPGYSQIVRRPMEMDTIDEKINKKCYSSAGEFADDVRLMLNNCRLYNGPNSEYTETANELEDLFKNQMKAKLPEYAVERFAVVSPPDHQTRLSPPVSRPTPPTLTPPTVSAVRPASRPTSLTRPPVSVTRPTAAIRLTSPKTPENVQKQIQAQPIIQPDEPSQEMEDLTGRSKSESHLHGIKRHLVGLLREYKVLE